MTERFDRGSEQVDRVGRTIGRILFAVGGIDIVFAGVEFAAHHPSPALKGAALGIATLGLGGTFWAKSRGERVPPTDYDLESNYNYQWIKDIGWVPLQPYDPDGSVGSPQPPEDDN